THDTHHVIQRGFAIHHALTNLARFQRTSIEGVAALAGPHADLSVAHNKNRRNVREAHRHRGVKPMSAVVQPIAIIPSCGCDFDRQNLVEKGYVAQHAYHPLPFETAMSATKPLAHVRRLNDAKKI